MFHSQTPGGVLVKGWIEDDSGRKTGGSFLDLLPMIYELKLGGSVDRLRETRRENTTKLS